MKTDDPFGAVIMDLTVQAEWEARRPSRICCGWIRRQKVIVSSGYSNDGIMAGLQGAHGFSGLSQAIHLVRLGEAVGRLLSGFVDGHCISDPLEDHRDPLPHPDAHGA